MRLNLSMLLVLGASAATAQSMSDTAILQHLAGGAASRTEAMQRVLHELHRAAGNGTLAGWSDRWRAELSRDGDGGSIDLAALEARLVAEHAEEREAYMRGFWAWDTDGDGQISPEEQATALERDPNNAYDLDTLDVNRDQIITADEILAVTERRQGHYELDDAAALFLFDLDDDGSVTTGEIDQVVATLQVAKDSG